MSKKDIAIFHLNIWISLVIQCFTGGIQKYIGSMKKVVLGEGLPVGDSKTLLKYKMEK